MMMLGMNGGQNGGSGTGGDTPDYSGMMSALTQGGGDPIGMLMGMMGGGDPRMKQMMALVQAFQNFNGTAGSTTGSGDVNKPENVNNAQKAPEKKPINELKPIKNIAPDRIHNSMEDYYRNRYEHYR